MAHEEKKQENWDNLEARLTHLNDQSLSAWRNMAEQHARYHNRLIALQVPPEAAIRMTLQQIQVTGQAASMHRAADKIVPQVLQAVTEHLKGFGS